MQNQNDSAAVVDVAVRAVNAEFTDGQGRRVTVPANDASRCASHVGLLGGTARFQVGAVSGRFTDAAQLELPVYTPATTRRSPPTAR